MAQTSQDVNLQLSLVRGRIGRGDIERQTGQLAIALNDYAAARRRASDLLSRDPKNSRILLERAVSRRREGLCLEALRRATDAEQAAAEASRDWNELSSRGALPASYRRSRNSRFFCIASRYMLGGS